MKSCHFLLPLALADWLGNFHSSANTKWISASPWGKPGARHNKSREEVVKVGDDGSALAQPVMGCWLKPPKAAVWSEPVLTDVHSVPARGHGSVLPQVSLGQEPRLVYVGNNSLFCCVSHFQKPVDQVHQWCFCTWRVKSYHFMCLFLCLNISCAS